jgi:hypothetical protein
MSLPAGAYQPFEIQYLDAGGEIGRCQYYGKVFNAANFDAQETLWATFLTKTDVLALGARQKDRYNDESIYSVARPNNGAARELKLLVYMQNDVTGRKFHFTVPTLDPTIPDYIDNISALDAVSVTSPAAITEFITAVEAFVRDPNSSDDACSVIGLKVVGRNT